MDFPEAEERELWGYKFKATVQEDRKIRKRMNGLPLLAEWRILSMKLQYGRFDPFSADGARMCANLAIIEKQLEAVALALIEEREKEN